MVVTVAGAIGYLALEWMRKRRDNRWLLRAGLDEIAAARRSAGLPPYRG